jgi:hypothetical protein
MLGKEKKGKGRGFQKKYHIRNNHNQAKQPSKAKKYILKRMNEMLCYFTSSIG